MSVFDGISHKSIEIAPKIGDGDNDSIKKKEIPLLAKLAVKLVIPVKDSDNGIPVSKDLISLRFEVSKALENLIKKRLPNKSLKDDFEEQIESACEAFISEITNPDSNTSLIKAIKANNVIYQPLITNSPECYFKINGYINKRLFTLLKKYASDQDRDYMSLNDSVKDCLAKLLQKGVIEKFNKGYRLPGNAITKTLEAGNYDSKLTACIDFRRKHNELKVSNSRLPENIERIVSKLQNTYFEPRDITELLFNCVYQMKIVLDSSTASEDEDKPSILETIASKIKTPEEQTIEKISNEEVVSISEIVSEMEFQLDEECKQVNQIQKHRNKYRTIHLGYFASQQYFENNDIQKMHKEHLSILTPSHPDYANRILNFLDKFTPADSNKIKAGISTIKASIASYNSAFDVATDNITLLNKLKVKNEYASKLVKYYFELLGETY